MTKTEIYLGLTGMAVCAALACEMTGFSPSGHRQQNSASALNSAGTLPASLSAAQAAGGQRSVDGSIGSSEQNISAIKSIVPQPGVVVSDQAILKLCGLVNLANSPNAAPDKEQWQEALPIAQKLLVAQCDCAQRNWLTHFVEMGDYAMNGDNQNYLAAARGLVTLPRNDQQASGLASR